jgi:hypothetical protein
VRLGTPGASNERRGSPSQGLPVARLRAPAPTAEAGRVCPADPPQGRAGTLVALSPLRGHSKYRTDRASRRLFVGHAPTDSACHQGFAESCRSSESATARMLTHTSRTLRPRPPKSETGDQSYSRPSAPIVNRNSVLDGLILDVLSRVIPISRSASHACSCYRVLYISPASP